MDFLNMTPFELGESSKDEAIPYLKKFIKYGTTIEKKIAITALIKLTRKSKFNIKSFKSILLKNLNIEDLELKKKSLMMLSKCDLINGDFEKIKEIACNPLEENEIIKLADNILFKSYKKFEKNKAELFHHIKKKQEDEIVKKEKAAKEIFETIKDFYGE